MRLATLFFVLPVLAAPARAQLVLAAEAGDDAWHVDVATGQATRLWPTNSQVNALVRTRSARSSRTHCATTWSRESKAAGPRGDEQGRLSTSLLPQTTDRDRQGIQLGRHYIPDDL
jgi:hypothetical protein